MTDRYDDLSDRARWFLNNFDEIDLADLCASQEASNKTRQEAIDRLLAFCDDIGNDHDWRPPGPEIAARIRTLIAGEAEQPAARHDDGPSVAEAAKADRNWDVEKAGE